MDIYLETPAADLYALRAALSSDMDSDDLDIESILDSSKRKIRKLESQLHTVNNQVERMREDSAELREDYEELDESVVAIDEGVRTERERMRLLSVWAGKKRRRGGGG